MEYVLSLSLSLTHTHACALSSAFTAETGVRVSNVGADSMYIFGQRKMWLRRESLSDEQTSIRSTTPLTTL